MTQSKTDYSKKTKDIYSKCIISREIVIPITYVGNNIKQTLEKSIINEIEGKCIVEGYIKPNSIKILSYSNGIVESGYIRFCVIIECYTCSPVEGMIIECIAKNITKAGIRAETNDVPSPVVIFIARDHHYSQEYFSKIKENDLINIRVIGQRFELNDTYISIIAELIEPREIRKEREKKEKIKKEKDKKIKQKKSIAEALIDDGVEDINKHVEPHAEPDAEEPDAKEPDAEEPDAEEPDAEEPDAEEPDVEEPDVENIAPDDIEGEGLENEYNDEYDSDINEYNSEDLDEVLDEE
tara:strand:+ start:2113 stop:3000 length:888 start_codon:yes stop_codon:yes gene_type:complete